MSDPPAPTQNENDSADDLHSAEPSSESELAESSAELLRIIIPIVILALIAWLTYTYVIDDEPASPPLAPPGAGVPSDESAIPRS